MAAGKSNTAIAAMAGCSRQAVDLYKRAHLQPAMNTAIKARAFDEIARKMGVSDDEIRGNGILAKGVLAAQPYLDRVAARFESFDKLVPVAVKAKDLRGFSNLVATELDAVELHARLSGVLDVAPVTNVQIACLLLPSKPVEAPVTVVEVKAEK